MGKDSYKDTNYSLLKKPIAFFCILFLISSAAMAASWFYYSYSLQEASAAKRHLTQAVAEKRDAARLVTMIDGYEARYKYLKQEYYFDPDLKLRWLESIGAIADRLGVLGVDYTIGALVQAELPESLQNSGLSVFKMPINLKLELIHEGVFLAFESELSRSKLGLYTNDGCEVQRETEQFNLQTIDVNVRASCDYSAYLVSIDGETEVTES